MKKIYKTLILSICLFVSTYSFAVVHTITVMNSSFSPNSLNVNVGDTVHWTLGSGFPHTTTSTQVPSGAAGWNNNINSSTPDFSYVVTVAGIYNYECTIHSFTGQFVALNTGITTPDIFSNFNIYSVRPSTYTISYTLMHSADVKISVYDLTGKSARVLNSSVQSAGDYLNTYYLEDLKKGIYLLEIFIGNRHISKRLILD